MFFRLIKLLTFACLAITLSLGVSAEEKKDSPKKQVIIGFKKKTDQQDIKALEEKFNLKAVKRFKRISAACYEVADVSDLKSFIKKVQEEDIVRYAERNGKVSNKKKS